MSAVPKPADRLVVVGCRRSTSRCANASFRVSEPGFRCWRVALGTGPGPVPLAPSDGGGAGNTESVPRRTVIGGGRSPAPGVGLSAVGTVAAYAAAIVAFGYALVNLYGAVGGRGLAGTVGGYAEQMARRGSAAVVLLAVVAVAAKAVGGLIALALARPRGAGRSALVAAGRFGRGQRAAHRVRRSQRGRRCPGPVGCPAPFGERGPDGPALACRGLGPVVLGVGDLAGGGNRQLLAAEHQPPRRVITQVSESTSGLNARPHSTAAMALQARRDLASGGRAVRPQYATGLL
jgi:hypothetical protein